ncbi:Rieske (2Fe-2S) protein [Paenibacillus koleovorans]|uniref:Rieske (2Fe-2S) protein n=1 Tax=Paenibacillus koleovorans TaxID=121608 RepID=UPI000FDA68B0|nr:Rieske 2Fe-2S domain-containing protein [Paenibacillus koleovorans]
MSKHVICHSSEIKVGAHKVFTVGRHSFGLFKVEGSYYALKNLCPHQGMPLCEGAGVFDQIEGEVTADRKLREFVAGEKNLVACPWHGIEFDIRTGQCLYRKDWKVRTYEVFVDADDNLQVELPD